MDFGQKTRIYSARSGWSSRPPNLIYRAGDPKKVSDFYRSLRVVWGYSAPPPLRPINQIWGRVVEWKGENSLVGAITQDLRPQW